MTTLSVEDLTVAYGRTEVVHQVSLRVEQAELVGVLGANGAGKTTTLKAIAGILRSRRGRIVVDGEVVTGLDSSERVRRGVVLVPEGRHLFARMSVEENLRVSWEVLHRGRKSERAPFERVYDLFPRLAERRRQSAGSLSGGEQQMVALGRGLLSEPKVLLLDEPSLGLAPALIDEVFDAIVRLNGDGLAVLMVEQDAARAFEICNRAYVVERGRTTIEGTIAELSDDPRVVEAFLGVANGDGQS